MRAKMSFGTPLEGIKSAIAGASQKTRMVSKHMQDYFQAAIRLPLSIL